MRSGGDTITDLGLSAVLMSTSVDPLSVGVDIGVNLIGAVLVAGLSYLFWWSFKFRARKLWPFNGNRFAVVLATSTATHTGKYTRPASGIGQVRALAILIPSIYRAWRGRLDVSNVLLSADMSDEWTRDLVVLGGSKNNSVTADVFDAYAKAATGKGWPAVGQVGSVLTWEGEEFSAETGEDSTLRRDFGLVLRWSNPFDRNFSVIVLAGASTYGTIAASMWYVGNEQPGNTHESRALRSAQHFIALVEADVKKGHVVAPTLLRGAPLV